MCIFQYGSNCDAERLNSSDRLNGVAKSLGKALLHDYELEFSVYSISNGCAASHLAYRAGVGQSAWGVLYEIPNDRVYGRRSDALKTLEQIEGNRYISHNVVVNWHGTDVTATTFLARDPQPDLRTSPEYVSHIVRGLRASGVDEAYIDLVKHKAIISNPEHEDQFRSL